MIKRIRSSKHKQLFLEFSRYLIVGGLAFVLDFTTYSILLFCNEPVPFAATIGFVLGLGLNYFLSVNWAFNNKNAHGIYAFMIFLVTGIIHGLRMKLFSRY